MIWDIIIKANKQKTWRIIKLLVSCSNESYETQVSFVLINSLMLIIFLIYFSSLYLSIRVSSNCLFQVFKFLVFMLFKLPQVGWTRNSHIYIVLFRVHYWLKLKNLCSL